MKDCTSISGKTGTSKVAKGAKRECCGHQHDARPRITLGGVVPIIVVLVVQFTAFLLPKALIPADTYYVPVAPAALDTRLPFVPAFVIFYVGAFVQWAVYYVQLAMSDEGLRFRFLSAEVISKLICMVCFFALPWTIVRPELGVGMSAGVGMGIGAGAGVGAGATAGAGAGFFSWVIGIIYAVDTPLSLCPSLHCLQSYYCTRRLCAVQTAPRWVKVASALFTLGVCASTVLIKQHYLVDIFAGILVAEAGLQLATRTHFNALFARFCARLCAALTPAQ